MCSIQKSETNFERHYPIGQWYSNILQIFASFTLLCWYTCLLVWRWNSFHVLCEETLCRQWNEFWSMCSLITDYAEHFSSCQNILTLLCLCYRFSHNIAGSMLWHWLAQLTEVGLSRAVQAAVQYMLSKISHSQQRPGSAGDDAAGTVH